MTSDAIQAGASFDLMRMDRRIEQRLRLRRLAKVAALSGLCVVGATRGGVLGWLSSGVGLLGLAREVGNWLESRPHWQKAAARGHLPGARLLRTTRRNRVDHDSSASFPASDSPARYEG
jgi:hypothetical protein